MKHGLNSVHPPIRGNERIHVPGYIHRITYAIKALSHRMCPESGDLQSPGSCRGLPENRIDLKSMSVRGDHRYTGKVFINGTINSIKRQEITPLGYLFMSGRNMREAMSVTAFGKKTIRRTCTIHSEKVIDAAITSEQKIYAKKNRCHSRYQREDNRYHSHDGLILSAIQEAIVPIKHFHRRPGAPRLAPAVISYRRPFRAFPCRP
jgi:hypothetical protein